MRRPAVRLIALALALATFVGGFGTLLGAQEASTPAPTEYFPPYDRDYGSSGVMIVPLGEAALSTDTGPSVQATVTVEFDSLAGVLAEEPGVGQDAADNRLMLVQIRLDETATSPTLNEQEGSEVISVDTGAVAFTFETVDPDARFISGDETNTCAGAGCPLARKQAEDGPEIVLLPGDRIIHNGHARYTYRYDPSTDVPSAGSDAPGLIAPGFAAPGALPALACSGGCRARLTIACANGCRY